MEKSLTPYRLSILASDKCLHYMTFSPIVDNSLKSCRIDYPTDMTSAQSALENTVYDTPTLLEQYSRVDTLVDTRRYVTVEADNDHDATMRAETLLATLYPETHSYEVITHQIGRRAWIAMAVDKATTAFLRRTFDQPTINHRLTPLALYLGHRSRFGNGGRIHVSLHDNSLDIIAYEASSLLMINTFDATSANDAIYFILATADMLDFDISSDRLFITGESTYRADLIELLDQHLVHPMPMIYPSEMLRAGGLSLNVPIEIITLPLCAL